MKSKEEIVAILKENSYKHHDEGTIVSENQFDEISEIIFLSIFAELSQVKAERDMLRFVCEEAKLQIEYLHGKFKATGSGNSVLNLIKSVLNSVKENGNG